MLILVVAAEHTAGMTSPEHAFDFIYGPWNVHNRKLRDNQGRRRWPDLRRLLEVILDREFSERDVVGGPPVAIVNEAWARINLSGANPLGKHVVSYGLRMKPQEIEIIGLAKNAKYDDLTGDFPAVVYLPLQPNLDVPIDEMTFFLRTSGNPGPSSRAGSRPRTGSPWAPPKRAELAIGTTRQSFQQGEPAWPL